MAAIPEKWLPLSTWEVSEQLFSDHHPCLLTIDIGRKPFVQKKWKRWSIKKADWETFARVVENQLCMIDSVRVKSLDEHYRYFYEAVLQAAKRSVPFGRRKREAPWWSPEASEVIQERTNKWKEYRNDPNEQNKAALEQAQRQARIVIDKLKRESWRELTSTLRPTDNDAKLWRITKAIENGKSENRILCPPESEQWLDKKRATWFVKSEIKNVRNHKVDKTVRNEYRKALDEYHNWAMNSERGQKAVFGIQHLETEWKQMNPQKTGGPDEVQISFLQDLPSLGKQWLLECINSSYVEGRTPAKWRFSRLIPIPKPGVKGSSDRSPLPR